MRVAVSKDIEIRINENYRRGDNTRQDMLLLKYSHNSFVRVAG